MSAIEDTRKILQDFLAPELRAVSARLDALEKKVDTFEKSVEKRFNDAERRADRRHDEVMMTMRQVIDVSAIQQRLTKPESQQMAHQ